MYYEFDDIYCGVDQVHCGVDMVEIRPKAAEDARASQVVDCEGPENKGE